MIYLTKDTRRAHRSLPRRYVVTQTDTPALIACSPLTTMLRRSASSEAGAALKNLTGWAVTRCRMAGTRERPGLTSTEEKAAFLSRSRRVSSVWMREPVHPPRAGGGRTRGRCSLTGVGDPLVRPRFYQQSLRAGAILVHRLRLQWIGRV